LDLFSGIGGFALAAEWAGFKTIGFVEIDKYCQMVLRKHWPDVPIVSDINDVKEDTFGYADLITGGFPCQPFSVAGKQQGDRDDRYLWPAMLKVIEIYKSTWVLGENVAGIVNMALDTVLSDLENAGYEILSFVIPACAVDAWHRRDRVWIVAHRKGGENYGRKRGIMAETQRCRESINAATQPGSQTAADTEQQQWDRRADWSGWWDREPLETVQDVWGNRGKETWMCFPESLLGRVAYGIPSRVDRLKSLGNAIVPQVAYQILKGIAEIEGACTGDFRRG